MESGFYYFITGGKLMKKWTALLLVMVLVLSIFPSCRATKDVGGSKADSSQSSGEESALSSESFTTGDGTSTTTSASAGTATSEGSSVNSLSSTAAGNDWSKNWTGSSFTVQDLGKVNLDAYPVDTDYDWGQCILKIGNTYKMWWTRGAPYDSIWYAESRDLKNWTNLKMILRVKKDTKWMKMHIADPAVVYVNGKYYFYLETNATIDGTNASDSNIVLATSTDGVNLTLYPNNDDPQSVMSPPADTMNKGKYGVGQPSVIYKDGKFWMYYLDAATGSDCTRLATSKDGIHFTSNNSNPKVFDRGGVGVTYNSLIKKFLMTYTLTPYDFDKSKPRNNLVYNMESSDGLSWTYKTKNEAWKNPFVVSNSSVKTRCFSGFVTNAQGIVDTPTMYEVYSDGKLAAANEWWMANFSTFDGHIVAVNPKEYGKRTIDLPNGKTLNSTNLKAYADTNTVWNKLSASAKKGTPVIDGNMDAAYNSAQELSISRQVSNYASLPTKTHAKARVLWDSSNLYIYAHVYDSKVSYSYKISKLPDMYHRDSIAFFVDVPHNYTGTGVSYTALQYAFELCANGDMVVLDPSQNLDITSEFKIKKYVKRVSDGYIVEASVSWLDLVKSQIKQGKTIGLDISINDDLGRGDRDSQVVWSDYTGNAFQYIDHLGNLTLN